MDTSEGLQILKEAQIERVIVNDGTQQVNLVLKDPWTHKSTGVNDRGLGWNDQLHLCAHAIAVNC